MSNITKKGFKVLSPFGNVTTGKIFFVDSSNTSDKADGGTGASAADWGTDPDRPFATLDYAIGQCTASKGDIIYVMPGHTETIDSTGDLIPDVAGISIIGLGRGSKRPTFSISTSGANASAIGITGDSTYMENLIFRAINEAGSSGVGINIGADDVELNNCVFDHDNSTGYFSNTIEIATGSDRARIRNCKFFNKGTTSQSAKAIDATGTGATYGVEIIGNTFTGNWTVAVLRSSTDAMQYNWNISNNIISNNSTVATSLLINMTSSQQLNGKSAGILCNNVFMTSSSVAATTAIVAQCFNGANNKFILSSSAFIDASCIESS